MCQQVVFCGKKEKDRTPLCKRGKTLQVLWDTRYGRAAHSVTFSSSVTFGMLRKLWKLQDVSTVPRNNCGQLQKSLHHKECVYISPIAHLRSSFGRN